MYWRNRHSDGEFTLMFDYNSKLDEAWTLNTAYTFHMSPKKKTYT